MHSILQEITKMDLAVFVLESFIGIYKDGLVTKIRSYILIDMKIISFICIYIYVYICVYI